MSQPPQSSGTELLSKEQISGLLRASSLLNSTLDPRQVLDALMELAGDLLNVEASSVILLDERGKRLFFKAAAGKKAEEIMKFTLSPEQGIVGWVIKNRRPYTAPDVADDPHWSQDVARTIGFDTRSIICVPLLSRGRLIGALEAINKRGEGQFDQGDVAMLVTLADQAALAIQNARLHEGLARDNDTILTQLQIDHRIVGKSPRMAQLLELIHKVTPTDSTLLIRGESGTGKELIARTIHYNSPRRAKPFTCVNCTLYSDTLIESELFGHEQGSFTGASRRRIGRFESADRGTIFLDEVGSVSPEAQLKLLRVLQEREFERLGGSETIRVDVRVIAATNENLEEAIRDGRFREDLYYRLKVIEIAAPPLRELPEDIPLIAEHFLKELADRIGRPVRAISPAAMELFARYPWPGNVRELKNTIERALVLGSGDTILPEHLPPEIRTPASCAVAGFTLKDAER
ncbi:MAG: sigma 54-interacting transcriptional regulator, partial [Candidatus Aureabacteria bacterium]|nr:sigma 54-interacting transcriptional regulator [Candidatus Auribacterota bacterium]